MHLHPQPNNLSITEKERLWLHYSFWLCQLVHLSSRAQFSCKINLYKQATYHFFKLSSWKESDFSGNISIPKEEPKSVKPDHLHTEWETNIIPITIKPSETVSISVCSTGITVTRRGEMWVAKPQMWREMSKTVTDSKEKVLIARKNRKLYWPWVKFLWSINK